MKENPLDCIRPLLCSPMSDETVGRIMRRVVGVITNPLTDSMEEAFAAQIMQLHSVRAKEPKKVAAGRQGAEKRWQRG